MEARRRRSSEQPLERTHGYPGLAAHSGTSKGDKAPVPAAGHIQAISQLSPTATATHGAGDEQSSPHVGSPPFPILLSDSFRPQDSDSSAPASSLCLITPDCSFTISVPQTLDLLMHF